MNAEPILVYRFRDAPEEFRDLSEHGGDEDWLAVMPAAMADRDPWVRWLESGSGFGICDVSKHWLPDGRKIFIGAHA